MEAAEAAAEAALNGAALLAQRLEDAIAEERFLPLEASASATGPSIDSGGRGKDGWCLCERLVDVEEVFEPRWAELKDVGNERFRAEEYDEAIASYTRGLDLARSPFPQTTALYQASQRHDPSRAFPRTVAISGVFEKIVSYLPVAPRADVQYAIGDVTMTLTAPNLPAAVG